MLCYCDSSKNYEDCCQPFIEGQDTAKSPEQLMRSRYTAFALGEADYLLATWDKSTRPESLDDAPMAWVSLEIRSAKIHPTNNTGRVEFVARLIDGDEIETLHEDSSFVLNEGRWYYVDGVFKEECGVKQLRASDPCPCQSGKPYKGCHKIV